MTLRCVFTEKAQADLQAIIDYSLERWGAPLTMRYIDRVEARVEWLAENPSVGLPRDELLAGVKSFPEGQHLIYYMTDAAQLIVLRVKHQSADELDETGLSQ